MGSGIPNLKDEYQGGNALLSVPASDLSVAMACINALGSMDAENMVVEISSNGQSVRFSVNFDASDFQVDLDSKLVQTRGATGTTLNGDEVVNGLIKSIGV